VTLHLDVRATLPSRTGRVVQRLLDWAGRRYTFEVIARRVTARRPAPVSVPVSIRFTIDLVPEQTAFTALEPAPVLLDVTGDETGRDPLDLFHTESIPTIEHPPVPVPVFFPQPEEPPLTKGFRLPPGPAKRSLPVSIAARGWTTARARARGSKRALASVLSRLPAVQAVTGSSGALLRRVRVAAVSQVVWTPVMAVAAPVQRSGATARRWLDATAGAMDDVLDRGLVLIDRVGSRAAIATGAAAIALTATGIALIVAGQTRQPTAGSAANDQLDDRVSRVIVDDPPRAATSGLPGVVESLTGIADFSPTNDACWEKPPEFHVAALNDRLPTLDAFAGDLGQSAPQPERIVTPPVLVLAQPDTGSIGLETRGEPARPASAPTREPAAASRQHPANVFVGTIEISSTPTGAAVTIDGVTRGATPLAIRGVQAGAHAVRVELAGFERWTRAVSVESGRRLRLAPIMRPIDTGDDHPD
jgi:hypothetical protein